MRGLAHQCLRQNLSTIFVSLPVKYLPLLLTHPRQTIILCLTDHVTDPSTDTSIQQINMRFVAPQNYLCKNVQIFVCEFSNMIFCYCFSYSQNGSQRNLFKISQLLVCLFVGNVSVINPHRKYFREMFLSLSLKCLMCRIIQENLAFREYCSDVDQT